MMGTHRTSGPPAAQPRRSAAGVLARALRAAGLLLVLLLAAILLFPDPFLNVFLKGRIEEALQHAAPDYSFTIDRMHYSIWTNDVRCDAIRAFANDSTMRCTAAMVSVRGIRWLTLLSGSQEMQQSLRSSRVDIRDCNWTFPRSSNALSCGSIQLTWGDSVLTIDSMVFQPSVDDRQFFAQSRFRKQLFRVSVSHLGVAGLDVDGLLAGIAYHARRIDMGDVSLEILIDKEKPYAATPSPPPMPGQMLSSLKADLRVDSTRLEKLRVRYEETWTAGGTPAVIAFDSMRVSVTGIANHTGRDPISLEAQGVFMHATPVRIAMLIPLPPQEGTFRYSGSVGAMDLQVLNEFLETAEQTRIKSGKLQAASFDISVVHDVARGTVGARYTDLVLATIDTTTGSEEGVGDRLASFVANTFKIRRTNAPDRSGLTTVGNAYYARLPDDAFFRFIWFGLRNGLKDLVGF